MAESSYSLGGLSALIANKTDKSKKKEANKLLPSQEKLNTVFDDPSAEEYSRKPVTPEPEQAPKLSATEERRKEVREKSKLVKLRQREKLETGHRTVFVGNVPVEATKKDILKFFKKYGAIESVRFRNIMRKDLTKPLKASAIKRDIHPSSKSMSAYIVFCEEKCAIRALKRNGKELLGCHLRVDLASSTIDRQPNRKCSIFIGNLPFDAHEETLWTHFQSCGDVVNVRIIKDKETRLGKGFGYVEFKNADGVTLALQMDGQALGKNKLRVQRCVKQTNRQTGGGDDKSWAGAIADRPSKQKYDKKKLKKKNSKEHLGKPPKKSLQASGRRGKAKERTKGNTRRGNRGKKRSD